MKIIGLTGGIASGKNFVADIFAQKGAVIFDADKEVHHLLEADVATISEVKQNFPESFINGKIERKILGKIVFADEEKLRILENILHPQVRQKYKQCLAEAQKKSAELLVLNIPLLLETEGYKCDKIIAIIAGETTQKKRFLIRSQTSEEKFYQIKRKQISDEERIKRADFVIQNDGTKPVQQQVESIIANL